MEEFMIDELKAKELSPLDGRYADIKELLSPFFSEYAYVKYRVFVEIKWLIYLIENNFLKSRTSQCFISLSISLGALFIKFMSSKKEPRKFEFKNAAQIN